MLDGVYVRADDGVRFKQVKAPNNEELTALVYAISERVGRYLLRQGLLVQDMENSYLHLETLEEGSMDDLIGSSITYRIAVGAHQGRKAFTVQRLPPKAQLSPVCTRVAKVAGFSLHAGVSALGHEREKLERLCRTIARPAVCTQRLSLSAQGDVEYQLKNSYRDGTTEVVLEPLDFTAPAHPWARGISASLHVIARLAALVPKPRVNQTRFHGVFAPNAKLCVQVTLRKRTKPKEAEDSEPVKTLQQRRVAMTWAQRLKRVFNIDITVCTQCGGPVKVMASIEDPVVIEKILAHIEKQNPVWCKK